MPQYTDPYGDEFEVTDSDLAFLEKISPTFAGKKYNIPPPRFAPRERERRRYAFRNLLNLHKRKCDFSGKPIVSHLAPDEPAVVYHSDVWWSDAWDALSYGVDFDFTRTFFDQFLDLYRRVPVLNHYVIFSENCEYINGAHGCRNCYLSYNLDHCEHGYYIGDAVKAISCVDCLGLTECELCYECISCDNCYGVAWGHQCVGCTDSLFLTDCRQCRKCIGCANLVNKEYYVFNQKVSPVEFEEFKQQFSSRQFVEEFKLRFYKHQLQYPKKHYFGHANDGFSGHNVHHLKNSYNCFECFELEDCKNCSYVHHAHNCLDYTIFGEHSQWMYNSIAAGINCSNDAFCVGCWSGSSNNLYCQLINATSNCFGCCGLKNKEYCIFNKQYPKDDYERMAGRIIEHMQKTGEWGEFFPPSISPFAFNKTDSFLYHPLPKEEALRRGYNWKDEEPVEQVAETYPVPDNIAEVANDITSQVLKCSETGKAFRVIPSELEFYKKQLIPVPSICPDVRIAARYQARLPRQLWNRECAQTGAKILTPYNPERPERVISEEAYLKEVY